MLPTVLPIIRFLQSMMISTAFVGVVFTSEQSFAYVCATMRDVSINKRLLNVLPGDFVVAVPSHSKTAESGTLGVFDIRMRLGKIVDSSLVALELERLRASHVLYGNVALEGRPVIFMHIFECEEYGCKLRKMRMEDAKHVVSNFARNVTENNNHESTEKEFPSPPYRILFLKKYEKKGPVNFGNASPIWAYASKTLGLKFYKNTCGELVVSNLLEDSIVKDYFRSITRAMQP